MAILKIILIVVFLVAALAVTVIVLLQEGKSAGLGSLTGTVSNDSYWDKNKKYSLEGKFEKWTKIMAAVFVLSALVLMLMPSKSGTKAEVVTPSTATESTTANESASPEATDAVQSPAADTSTDAPASEAPASPEASESTSAAQ